MISTAHPVAPEDLMALLDGELAPEEAKSVSAHIDHCAECAQLAAQFRAVSGSLAAWTIPDAPAALEEAVLLQAENSSPFPSEQEAQRRASWTAKSWIFGGGSALAAIVIFSVILVRFSAAPSLKREMTYLNPTGDPAPTPRHFEPAMPEQKAMSSTMANAPAPVAGIVQAEPTPASQDRSSNGVGGPDEKKRAFSETSAVRRKASPADGSGPLHQTANAAPMIARTVSLSITVKDVSTARASLDSILAHYQGYSAQLTVNTEQNSQRTVQASLRIPAPQLASALADLKSLGRVETETQSGEEVTQQHANLAARLQNSRETEQRLRDILSQRTGRIDDVLEVEEEIARVRGEIESMEAEQLALEHRVDFATIDLRLTEDLKVQFGTPSPSAGTQIRNSFVSGIRNALAALLGFVLFFEETAPVLLVWLAILGTPAFFLLRRYRRIHARG